MIAPIVNPLSRLVWLKKDLKVWFLRCCLSMRRTSPWVYNQFGLNRPSVSSIRTVLLGLDWVVSEWEHLGSDLAKSHPEGKTAPAGCQAGKHEPNLAKALQFHGILWFDSLESALENWSCPSVMVTRRVVKCEFTIFVFVSNGFQRSCFGWLVCLYYLKTKLQRMTYQWQRLSRSLFF